MMMILMIKTQLEMCVFCVFFSYPHIKLACVDWKTNTTKTFGYCSYLQKPKRMWIIHVLLFQSVRIYVENSFGAGESPCLSASLFLSSINVAAGRRSVGRVARHQDSDRSV